MRRRGARERVSRSEVRRQWQAAEVPLMQFTGPVVKLELAAFGERVRVARSRWRRSPAAVTA
jgi:hypothetical protein